MFILHPVIVATNLSVVLKLETDSYAKNAELRFYLFPFEGGLELLSIFGLP